MRAVNARQPVQRLHQPGRTLYKKVDLNTSWTAGSMSSRTERPIAAGPSTSARRTPYAAVANYTATSQEPCRSSGHLPSERFLTQVDNATVPQCSHGWPDWRPDRRHEPLSVERLDRQRQGAPLRPEVTRTSRAGRSRHRTTRGLPSDSLGARCRCGKPDSRRDRGCLVREPRARPDG